MIRLVKAELLKALTLPPLWAWLFGCGAAAGLSGFLSGLEPPQADPNTALSLLHLAAAATGAVLGGSEFVDNQIDSTRLAVPRGLSLLVAKGGAGIVTLGAGSAAMVTAWLLGERMAGGWPGPVGPGPSGRLVAVLLCFGLIGLGASLTIRGAIPALALVAMLSVVATAFDRPGPSTGWLPLVAARRVVERPDLDLASVAWLSAWIVGLATAGLVVAEAGDRCGPG